MVFDSPADQGSAGCQAPLRNPSPLASPAFWSLTKVESGLPCVSPFAVVPVLVGGAAFAPEMAASEIVAASRVRIEDWFILTPMMRTGCMDDDAWRRVLFRRQIRFSGRFPVHINVSARFVAGIPASIRV